MAYIIQVNPIDLEKNIALGIDLQFSDKVGSVYRQNYTSKEQALSNAKNLLLTEPGERVMLPNFGCGLRRTLFEQLSKESLDALDARIRGSFQNFLPEIFIEELTLTPEYDRNRLFVKLSISLQQSGIDTQTILLEVNG